MKVVLGLCYTEYMTMFFVFLFGLIIGSFLNSVIYRLEVGGSIARERSRCPKCGHILAWYELVPLLSFAVQLGRCRVCGERISLQYPLVELATAVFFTLGYISLPAYGRAGLESAYLLFVLASLLVIFVFDLKHYIIPNKVLYPLIVAALFHIFIGSPIFLPAYPLLSALSSAGFFLSIFILSRGEWIGFGDVKFGVFMGLFLGFPNFLVALFFSYVLGALIGGALLLYRRKTFKSQIPFGPFLIAGTLIAYFYGNEIMQWYLNVM